MNGDQGSAPMAISKKKLLEAFAVSELKDIAAHYDLKLKARSRKDWFGFK